MFPFQGLIFLFALNGFCFARTVTVNLTAADSTWVVSGYQTRLLSPIIIASCSDCTVQFMVRFENGTQNSTDFTITDSVGSVISSKTYKSASTQNLRGTITVTDNSSIGSYSLSFRRYDQTDLTFLYANRIFTIVPNDGYRHTYTLPTSGPYGTFATFTTMPSLYATATMTIQPTNQVNTSCEYWLYQGGYPSPDSLRRYQIHKFTAENSGDRHVRSFIPAYAATIYVPPNCPISVDAIDYSKDYNGKSVVTMNGIQKYGFVMSREFPGGMLGNGNEGMNVDLTYSLDKTVGSAYFNLLVDNFFNYEKLAQVRLLYDEKIGIILNETTNNFSHSQNASSLRVQFSSEKTLWSNLLLHFSITASPAPITPSPVIATTLSAIRTTTPKSSNNLSFLFISFIMVLFCALKL